MDQHLVTSLISTFIFFLGGVQPAESQIELKVRYLKRSKTFRSVITVSQDLTACSIELGAAGGEAGLTNNRTSVFRWAAGSEANTLIVPTIRGIKTSRRQQIPISFRAFLSCPDGDRVSDIQRVVLSRGGDNAPQGVKGWLNDLRAKAQDRRVSISQVFSGLSFSFPIDLQNAGDSSNRIFVVEQRGKIYAVTGTGAQATKSLYIDLSDRVSQSGSERGLLGLAFHPQYTTNGYFYVNYTTETSGDTVIARFQRSQGDPNTGDRTTELKLLEVTQPFSNHNGGQLAFGPDGNLYISLGDGGSAGDPEGNGQDTNALLGKILRIDVNSAANGKQYAIPSDNPFVGRANTREEIFAYGLRNAWRFSFDFPTGRLWAADVGQNTVEEIDLIESGKNYGWNTMEGTRCYSPSSGCNRSGLTLPVFEYPRSKGVSVTGGYVYRGSSVPALKGDYLFADFVSGIIWTLNYDNGKARENELIDTELNISSFGRDESGELYLLSYGDGKIFQFRQN